MKYSFKNLNKSIDKWIKDKINLAPDKDYTESFLKEAYTDLVNTFDGFKTFIKHQHFQTTYHKYKIGDYDNSEKMFVNDDELITTYLGEKERNELLKSKKIKLVISEEIKERTKNKKNEITFIPVGGHYKIIDIAIKNDLFKTVKKAVIILEIKRKLDGTSQPLKLKKNNMVVHLLSFPFCVKKEYNTTRPIDNGSMNMDIISSEPDKVFAIAIRINSTHFIVTPKNENAKKDFREWFDNNFRKDDLTGNDLELMKTLIRDKNRFDLVSDQEQAYLKYLYIRNNHRLTLSNNPTNLPPRPSRSFPLLKDWYFQCWKIAKEAKLKTLDKSAESLNKYEIAFIKKNILDIDRKYFPELLPVGVSKITPAEKPYTEEKNSITAFKKWLNERNEDLEKVKFHSPFAPQQGIEQLTKSDSDTKDKIVNEVLAIYKGRPTESLMPNQLKLNYTNDELYEACELLTHTGYLIKIDNSGFGDYEEYQISPASPELPKRNFMAEERERLRKEGEEKDQQDELQRKQNHKTFIDENYDYSPTIEDFREELAVQKGNPEPYKFRLWLRETKKIYGNAKYYYTIWGARGTGVDRGELYTSILSLINEQIAPLIKSSPQDIDQQAKTGKHDVKSNSKESSISDYNPNHFNSECYNLFLHLIEKYEKQGKVKYINIWFFLKHHIDKDTYVFDMIQDDYTKLIKTKFNTQINKYAKAKIIFEDKELPKLKFFERDFRKLSKQVENT